MKPALAALAFFMMLMSSACTSPQLPSPAAGPIVIQSDTDIASTPIATFIPTETTDASSSTGEITMDDNGRTLNMKVGDSFLLHLDADFYDWAVEVDNQDVLSRKRNVTVINGAQGIYEALAPGTATLTASGNPKCLNSRPACLAPSVIFTITVIVQ